ncbi:hypothetical protein [Mesorhizobium sp. LNJC405B00]|uniref:hypothetical protein n=1 Tax=Mesorhizobium sp. LNJC405B00 TaxID=1287281 RepID=UPI001FD88EC1|nr:hypothetical protein [Mesorhizobium sp. LNJC405B00]
MCRRKIGQGRLRSGNAWRPQRVSAGGRRHGVRRQHYESQSPQTQFLFAGLVEVFRDSDTGRVATIPFSDLRKLFPLKTGAKSTIEFVELSPNKQPKSTKTLSLVVKGKETFSVGSCKYNVLAVTETFKNGAGETLDTFTALYAPDLQASLARRYDEGTSAESVNGYETIKPLSN